jgi:hypothetical protein
MCECQDCKHDCHCKNDLHVDICKCTNCKCKRTYIKEKDYGLDMSFENEVKYE